MDAQDRDLEFDGDGLDQLPQSTLENLELNALSSTQRVVAARKQRQYHENTKPLRLTRPITAPAFATTSKNIPVYADTNAAFHNNTNSALFTNSNAASVYNRTVAPGSSAASSDYGDVEDEEILDLNDGTFGSQPNTNNLQSNSSPGVERELIVLDNDAPPVYQPLAQSASHAPDDSIAHIRKLEAKLEALNLALEGAKADLQRQAGELSITRANKLKDAKLHQTELLALTKLRADDAAKQKAELDARKKEIEVYETSHRFTEHDLAQARDQQSKRLKTSMPAPLRRPAPQQSQSLPYRDGFDDDEIVTLSPSKPKARPKQTTPKVGEKRKRDAAVSPVAQLQFDPLPSVPPSPAAGSTSLDEGPIRLQDDSQFQMIRRLMNHRPNDSSQRMLKDSHTSNSPEPERVLETLSRLSFPSLPGQSISGLVTEGLSQFLGIDENDDFSSFACNLLSDLWDRSLRDKFYAPVYLILDLYEFVLVTSQRRPTLLLIDRFLPLAIRTIDLVAIPRVRQCPESELDAQLLKCINVDQILEIMHKMAFDASLSTDTCQAFWKKMEFDFALMMLNKSQPIPQILLVLRMLGTSALPETFSIISDNTQKQATLEGHTIDRLTTLLFERPEASSHEVPYEDTEITSLQIETIRTLTTLATTKHGSGVLAMHRTAIGRLIRMLHVSVTQLYNIPPTRHDVLGNTSESTGTYTIHELTVSLISLTVRLIHHLMINHGDVIDLREKLTVIPGGHHKFLISMTRIAFSEQLVFEGGLEDEAVDAAHDILDRILSPDEGEAVVQALETPRGSRASIRIEEERMYMMG